MRDKSSKTSDNIGHGAGKSGDTGNIKFAAVGDDVPGYDSPAVLVDAGDLSILDVNLRAALRGRARIGRPRINAKGSLIMTRLMGLHGSTGRRDPAATMRTASGKGRNAPSGSQSLIG